MKKSLLCLFLASVMIFTLTACGGNGGSDASDAGQASGQAQPADSGAAQTENGAEDGSGAAGGQAAEPAKLSGKISIFDLPDRDASILRGVKIIGASFGSIEDINGKESSLTDVRCIFEMNEWVSFFPDTDATYGLRVWILTHRDDQEYYADCKFSDLMPGFASYCDLRYPEDLDTPDESSWGDFYLNPDDCEPGYYDFVFTYEGKAIGVLLTRFYTEQDGLRDLSGPELEALMHE